MAKNRHKIKRINSGFSETGASYSRKALKGFTVRSGSPNEDINYNNMTLRQRSRILAMSGGFALSALKTNRTNVIGCGLTLKPVIDRDVLGLTEEQAAEWQKQAEREFALWAETQEIESMYMLKNHFKASPHSSKLTNCCSPVCIFFSITLPAAISSPPTMATNGIRFASA